MKNIVNYLMCIVIACMFVSGCAKREMIMNPNQSSVETPKPGQNPNNGNNGVTNVELNVDWAELGYSPNGVTVMFYPKEGGDPVTYTSHTVHTALLSVQEGTYDVVVFNNSPEEFGSVEFRGLEVYKTAEIFYSQKAASKEYLAMAKVNDFMVTKELQQLNVKPQNLFVDGDIRIEAKGVYNIRYMRAHITGLAGSYMLSVNVPKAGEEGFKTHTESWKLMKKNQEYATGVLTSTFRTFGLPEVGWKGDISAKPGQVKLHISMLLVDNKTVINRSFAVGDMIQVWSKDGRPVIYVTIDSNGDEYPLVIPDVKPIDGTAGGFGADVEDWGDDEEFDLGV